MTSPMTPGPVGAATTPPAGPGTTTPNAELAYRVLDHIDAHPEAWQQGLWVTDCGTAYCFAGWALTMTGHTLGPDGYGVRLDGQVVDGLKVRRAATAELAITEFEAAELFASSNDREDLGTIVSGIFGPRPGGAA